MLVDGLLAVGFAVREVTSDQDEIGVNWSLTLGEVPLGVVTCTSTVPAAWLGLTAVIEVAEVSVNEVAGLPPKVTPVAPSK